MRLLRALLRHKGENNAITAETLSTILGADTRTIAELVGILTEEGYWICSGMGYWWAEDERQWIDYQLKKERDRGIAIIRKTVRARKNSVNEPTLFEMAKSEKAA